MRLWALPITIIFCFLGCSSTVDVAQQKTELFEVDRAFSSASVELGTQKAFMRFMADSATMLRDDSYPITGRASIEVLFADWSPQAELTWEPVFADVSSSGDLGYTIGEYLYTNADSAGNEITGVGYYVTIWKKQADGSWKYVLDAGTNGIPEEEK